MDVPGEGGGRWLRTVTDTPYPASTATEIALMRQHLNNQDAKLDAILVQTLKTNGRVDKNTDAIAELQIVNREEAAVRGAWAWRKTIVIAVATAVAVTGTTAVAAQFISAL